MKEELKFIDTGKSLDKFGLWIILTVICLSLIAIGIMIGFLSKEVHDPFHSPLTEEEKAGLEKVVVTNNTAPEVIQRAGNITALVDRKNNLLLLHSPAKTNCIYELMIITDPEKKSGFLLGSITNIGPTTNIEFRISTEIFKQIQYPNFHIIEREITNAVSSGT